MVTAWQLHPLAVLLLVSAAFSTGVATYALRSNTPGSRYLAGITVCSALWSLGHGLRLASRTLDAKLFWLATLSALAAGLVPVAWLAFTLTYTGRGERLSWRSLLALSVPGLGAFLLAVTNPVHELLWRATLDASGPYVLLVRETQPLYLGYVLYAYLLFLAGTAVLVRQVVRTDQVFRKQGSLVLVAALVPFVGNVVWVLGITGPSVNLTPVGFTVSGVALAVAISRFGLLDLTPLARDAVVERMREGYLVVDTDGRVVDSNPAGRRLVGADPGIVGEPVADAVPRLVQPLADDAESAPADGTTRDRSDEEFEEWTDESVVEGSGDRLVGVDVSTLDFGGFEARLVILRDVTERRRRVAKIRRANRRLERFASVVSHDLRNPLNVASGRCDLIRSTGDLEHAEKTAEALSRMESIIDDVLTLTRTGRSVETTDAVSLDTLATRAWKQVATSDATLVVEEDVSFEADGDQLQRAFENLFRNSVEHGSTGPRSHTHEGVTVRVAPTADGFSVADDGPGIDPDRRESVFEFGETSSSGGTGIGLAIVREIVEAHGWTITVTEGPEDGARFVVSGVDLVEGKSAPTSALSSPPVSK